MRAGRRPGAERKKEGRYGAKGRTGAGTKGSGAKRRSETKDWEASGRVTNWGSGDGGKKMGARSQTDQLNNRWEQRVGRHWYRNSSGKRIWDITTT